MKFFGHDEPLGMPKGSVRATALFVLLAIIGIVQVAVIIQGFRLGTPITLIQSIESAVLVTIGYYYGKRSSADGNGS